MALTMIGLLAPPLVERDPATGVMCIDGRRVETHYEPLTFTSCRLFDWCATTEDYDGAPDAGPQPIGYGRTEADAVAELVESIEEYEG